MSDPGYQNCDLTETRKLKRQIQSLVEESVQQHWIIGLFQISLLLITASRPKDVRTRNNGENGNEVRLKQLNKY